MKFRTARSMQPRPQRGTTLLVSVTVHATDEGIYLGRVAYRDPSTDKILACTETKTMWEGGAEDVQHFAAAIGGHLQDVTEWTVA